MKTTNLTFLEACDAMRRGKCVSQLHNTIEPYAIKDGQIVIWSGSYWRTVHWAGADASYEVVPDPSKPKEVCACCGTSLKSEIRVKDGEGYCSSFCYLKRYPAMLKVATPIEGSYIRADIYGHVVLSDKDIKRIADAVCSELKK